MNIECYEPFFESIPNQERWQQDLYNRLTDIFSNPRHGDFSKWQAAVSNMPRINTSEFQFDRPIIEIGSRQQLSEKQFHQLHSCLKQLLPWRKGPFNLFGLLIDTEWRSQQKWDRIKTHLPDLKTKRVLDVGCGNGYYMLRMAGAGASQVIGVDPNLLFLAQFRALTQYLQSSINTYLLPIAFEDLSTELNNFDYVFSMGVLYHRRDPQQHLKKLFQHLAPGGTVYLETLIIDESHGEELIPAERYAGMRNVWNIPCSARAIKWLQQTGFLNCKLLDHNYTKISEQRSTQWMPTYSLSEFLDPSDSSKTIEGYPAPLRAIFSAQRPID